MASRWVETDGPGRVTWWGTYPVDPRYHLFMKEILKNLGKFGVFPWGMFLSGVLLEFSNLRDWLWLKVKDSLVLKLKKLDDFVWCLWLCNDTISLLNSNPKEVVCTHTHTRSPVLQLQIRTNLIFKWYQLSQCFLLVSVGWWHRIPCLFGQIFMATKWWCSKRILPKCP